MLRIDSRSGTHRKITPENRTVSREIASFSSPLSKGERNPPSSLLRKGGKQGVAWRTVWPAIAMSVVCGCAGSGSVFEIVDYRSDAPPHRYREVFSEAFFEFDGTGNVDVVLRRSQPSAGHADREITQIIHLRSLWRPIPGETVAERTQINGTVTYCIISGNLGATFEGAGSLFFTHNKRKDLLEGSLELAMLRPTRQLTSTSDFFDKAELSGRFTARRDGRRVKRIVNDINRRFGPRRGSR